MLCVCLLTHPEDIGTGCCSQPDELWLSANIDSGILELTERSSIIIRVGAEVYVECMRFGQLHTRRGKKNFYYECSSPNNNMGIVLLIFFLLFYAFLKISL